MICYTLDSQGKSDSLILGKKKEVAKKVAQEINRFVFYPVRPALEQIQKIEIAPAPAIPKVIPPKPAEVIPEKEKPVEKKPSKVDIYREPIE